MLLPTVVVVNEALGGKDGLKVGTTQASLTVLGKAALAIFKKSKRF